MGQWNLPNAWDPGFVLPKSVNDEGLERRAFITKMMPRGTYDEPNVGTGGYVVPEYVMDEGYGQGAFTTKWQKGGSYGPGVPNWLNQRPQVVSERKLPGGGRAVTIKALGDDEPLHPAFEEYGQRAASVMIGKVAGLPPTRREPALRAIMDKVDKSLWSRTQTIWKRYLSQGMAPAQAFPRALARAMSAGIAAEIVKTGISGAAPQAKSLLGLGCYGCMAMLGADEPAVAMCPPPAGFTWAAATAEVPGHWEKLRKGATPQPGPCDPTTGKAPTVEVRNHKTAYLKVGPFLFNPTISRVWSPSGRSSRAANIAAPPDLVVTDLERIPPDWISWINKALTQGIYPDDPHKKMTTDYMTSGGGYEADAGPWLQKLGIDPGKTPIEKGADWGLKVGTIPFAKLKHPTTGDDLEMRVILAKAERTKDWDAKTNPTVLKLYLSKVPDPGALASFWDALFTLTAVIADIADDILGTLGDLACGLIQSPAGSVAGAAAAGAAGAPPQVGTQGVAIAQAACGTSPPPPVPAPVVVSSSPILPLAIAGGALLLIAALATKGKKKTS